MEALPRRVDIEFAGRRLAVVHGGVRSINRFIFPSTDVRIKNKELDAAASDGGIAGHCGFPFSQLLGTRLWHNAGAIGLPANDGTPRGWYSVLTGDQSGIFITHRALEYDYQSAATKMRLAHLPEEYANALETGFWPSLDILPEKEIRHRGTRLEERSVFWPALISSSSEAPTEATLQH
jgi:hypothetical protein